MTTQYRRKPTIRAVQWLGTNFSTVLAFCSTAEQLAGQVLRMTITATGKKKNLHVGDWIIQNDNDDAFSMMTNDNFVIFYEEV